MSEKKGKPPLIPYILLKLILRGEDFYEFADDIDEIYQQMIYRGQKCRAMAWYFFRVLESAPNLIIDRIYWRTTMLRNYLKIALRNFQRHKGYSFINIAGFAIGMACCLLILIYVRHELGYDNYHEDAERVFRVVMDNRTPTANRLFAPVSPMVAPIVKEDYAQVEFAARACPTSTRLVKQGEIAFYEDLFMYADQELFDIFSIPFLLGNSQKALTRPQTLVISERMAIKYFAHTDPLGKTLKINEREYEITGVVADPPENTHMKYDLIASLETLADWEEMTNWYSNLLYTYLKLKPNVNMDHFSQQVSTLADKYIKEGLDKSGSSYRYFLQPISIIHLHSHLRYEIEPPGNVLYVYLFSFVGLFVLLIACLNFMSLTTASSTNRAIEVGLRKVIGAQRLQLIGQFLGESLLLALLSLGFAMILARVAIPHLNDLAGTSLRFSVLLYPRLLIALAGGATLVGLAAGLYPAFVLSGFRPIAVFKRSLSFGSRRFALRAVLVVVQFAISVFLIIGTLTMYKQFNFMKNLHLGFDKEQKLVLPLRGGISVDNNYETVKDLFAKHPSVTGATMTSTVPGRGVDNFGVRLVGEEDAQNQSMFHMYFDHDFIPNYGIEIVAGRAFQKGMRTDVAGAFLINEAALKAFNWSSPERALGKLLKTGFGGRVSPIIGVTKNFHFRGLQSKIEPLVMEYLPESFNFLTLTVDISNMKETLAFVESRWKELFPGNPFEHFFLDTDFDRQYHSDERLGMIFTIFTLLGLFIACLGLLGLALFTAESRTKEIGIRKVLGASVTGIAFMLSKQFTKWVLLANVIAWPVAYYFMHKWLENFAYRIRIDLLTFVLSGLFVLVIALLTVSYQSIKTAAANPVCSLRYE